MHIAFVGRPCRRIDTFPVMFQFFYYNEYMGQFSDLTFITNEAGRSLLDRFKVLTKDTRFFDVLVGYFYTSGFYALSESLEKTEKIRILIGIGTGSDTVHLINQSRQQIFQFSHAEAKEEFSNQVASEMEGSPDNKIIEQGVHHFLEWLKSGKLEIKAYPSQNIHAKLYIMTFDEGDRDKGRVITGSSNFTQAGLVDNLEFNVELKARSDYDFALQKFNELWQDAIDVKDEYVQTIETRTWLNDTVTPYELYLKFLYEYFKDEISRDDEVYFEYLPSGFKKLEYQEQAVLNAKKIIEEYGGVFISDVVGLGKTYISAMLSNQLDGRSLVIAPPVLLEKNNPGSWPNVFSDFGVRAPTFESIGKLDDLVATGTEKFKNIFIDEAHRFRSESNVTYEKLAQICRGKRVILVTATPYNNSPKDLLSQIKLFQNARRSTIPNIADIEAFFARLQKRLDKLDRHEDREEFISVSRQNAKEVREKVLKYLMVRRTRKEIERYFTDDLKKQNLKFPDVADPQPVFYKLNDKEGQVFDETIKLITKEFKYSRYTPLLYYKGEVSQPEKLAQTNMGKFMKILLIKRLESSFHAFKNSLDRFVHSYELFIKEFHKGNVYASKKHINRIFEFIDEDDFESIQRLIDEDKAEQYASKDFGDKFIKDLESDLEVLKEVQALWSEVKRDPKLLEFVKILQEDAILKKNKLIVFTESKETADYISRQLDKHYPGKVLTYTGQSSAEVRVKAIQNFDAKARNQADDYRVLIATEVLAEGVNLHRANVVINYDIPWNPTRLMQRVGRINRVDTVFDTIYTYNFFPSTHGNDQIKLREAAEAKIHAFIALLGSDARLLTDGETVESHELFNRLMSRKTITGEDETDDTELKYLQIIRDIRDKNPDLFSKIKRLPKKARTARAISTVGHNLLTYFRKGKIQKFFSATPDTCGELDFMTAAQTLEAETSATRAPLGKDFFELLEKNKHAFELSTMPDDADPSARGGRDSATQIIRILKAIRDFRQFTDEQESYLAKLLKRLEEGGLPRQTTKKALQELNKAVKSGGNAINPLKILALVQKYVPRQLLEGHFIDSSGNINSPSEVILSEYMGGA